MIPGGMTSVLQPLDVCLNKPFKANVKRQYTEWMAEELHELTPTGRVKRLDITLLCKWINNAWKEIPAEMVRRSFRKCSISNRLDGTEDDVVWDDDASIDSSGGSDSSDD